MIPEKEIVKISKFLSLVLRHRPETIGIHLDANGWTNVAVLLQQLELHGRPVTMKALEYVVANNSKKRFAFSDDRSMIRASQGHSVDVDLGYTEQTPPAVLYHGTAAACIDSIFTSGLEKRNRHHVHLSADTITAINVGGRHGKPVVLLVDSAQMAADGFSFFISENGVWLTDHVPVRYLKRIEP